VIDPFHGRGDTDYRLPPGGPEWAGRPIFPVRKTQAVAH
jgi:hypothetical protein